MHFHKNAIIAGALFLFFGCSALTADEIDLFVFAGQSNAQGWKGNAENYPADPTKIDENIRFFWVAPGISNSAGKWTTLGPQKGRFPKGHFGPEVTFARALAAEGKQVAVFKYSLGATSLANHWKGPGEKGMYDTMVVNLQKAIALLEADGHKVTLRAFVWIQGESDAQNDTLAHGYAARLAALIVDFRTNVAKDPDLLFLLGVDEQHPSVKARPAVVLAQRTLAARGKSIVSTSMIGLEKADATHLTPAGLEEHGRRLHQIYGLALKAMKRRR